MHRATPIIDLFAGPGGLSEGFSSYGGHGSIFDVRLSIEVDDSAFETLLLRKFFRSFGPGAVPDDYYEYIQGKGGTREELFKKHPVEAGIANASCWKARLGEVEYGEISERIESSMALGDTDHWVLLGGPPCQAYSLIGRSRMKSMKGFADDHRHTLYREYLKIVAAHTPTVFVMENVKGLLSSKYGDTPMFGRILNDLRHPWNALSDSDRREIPASKENKATRYRIYSFTTPVTWEEELDPTDYIIESEEFGVPQRRHRVILLGVRSDYDIVPSVLEPAGQIVTFQDVIGAMPGLRSRLTKTEDSAEAWHKQLSSLLRGGVLPLIEDRAQKKLIRNAISVASRRKNAGGRYVRSTSKPHRLSDWLSDERLGGVTQHEARGHMASDLHRYMFASSFARANGRSPSLRDFPQPLLPNHKSAKGKSGHFADRFRVQVGGQPSTTITAHIAKDGHYYIHPDPSQCRSLTVREAARLQTFPDNYFFEGNRTEQFRQVGNAVPPFLAFQMADVVAEIVDECRRVDAVSARKRSTNVRCPNASAA